MPGQSPGQVTVIEAIGPATRYDPWSGPTISAVTSDPILVYRVWGGGSDRLGGWLTPKEPTSRAAAIAGLALPPENAATDFTEVLVPAGVRIQTGIAGPNFGHPGGWPQVELLERIPRSCFGEDKKVPQP